MWHSTLLFFLICMQVRIKDEIKSSEKTYRNNLSAFAKQHLPTLLNTMFPALDKRQRSRVDSLFSSNLHQIILLNSEFDRLLTTCSISTAFLSILPFLAPTYAEYARVFNSVIQYPFSQSANRLDLLSHLLLPIQRIPRYQMLLHELLKHTPDSDPEYSKIHGISFLFIDLL